MKAQPQSDAAIVTRFAPSPNGPLHLGHAHSAIVAHDLARSAGGRFLFRIEDIDGPRSKPKFADAFRFDLEWLGLEWEEMPAQSTRLEVYKAAADDLLKSGLVYPCGLTRAQLAELPNRMGSDGLIYPGCSKGLYQGADIAAAALRLDVDLALGRLGELKWEDELAGMQLADPRSFGDVVLVRKDLPASYHLAATLDDAADGVTIVTRGADLFDATHIHRVLQALLGLPVPRWHHHELLLDETGQKLAKRRGSPSLSARREAGEDGLQLAEQLRQNVLGRNFPLGTCTR